MAQEAEGPSVARYGESAARGSQLIICYLGQLLWFHSTLQLAEHFPRHASSNS